MSTDDAVPHKPVDSPVFSVLSDSDCDCDCDDVRGVATCGMSSACCELRRGKAMFSPWATVFHRRKKMRYDTMYLCTR